MTDRKEHDAIVERRGVRARNFFSAGGAPWIRVLGLGGTLYFLFVGGFDPMECGPSSLDTNLRP